MSCLMSYLFGHWNMALWLTPMSQQANEIYIIAMWLLWAALDILYSCSMKKSD